MMGESIVVVDPDLAAGVAQLILNAVTNGVLDEVRAERRRQDEKWGVGNDHPDFIGTGSLHLVNGASAKGNCQAAFAKGNGSWSHILHEEFGEAIDEARAGDVAALRAELVQVAATAVKWIEALDRRLP